MDDIYLKYIQFRTLHYRYFTNNILAKIGIMDNNICSMCKVGIDCNYHMFFIFQNFFYSICVMSIRVMLLTIGYSFLRNVMVTDLYYEL